ncbi:MAG: alpha/beta fold hydrolase [Planctomycetota bacterium]
MIHSVTHAGSGAPQRWILFLHGILGQGSNWATFARRWVQEHPSWGAITVDLRMHGKSQGMVGPHDLRSAAADLQEVEVALGATIDIACGHSFGSKVAILYADERRRRAHPLSQLWVIDADPGVRTPGPGRGAPSSDVVEKVLGALESLPKTIGSRAEFAAHLASQRLEEAIIAWLGMNLERVGAHFEFRLELAAIRELLADFSRQDLWPLVEGLGPATAVGFVIGGASRVVNAAAQERMTALARLPWASCTTIENAGHWVHVDAPVALQRLLTPRGSTT